MPPAFFGPFVKEGEKERASICISYVMSLIIILKVRTQEDLEKRR